MASVKLWLVLWLEAEFSSTVHQYLIQLKGRKTSFIGEAPFWFDISCHVGR